jgi:hypothetical protein
MRNLVLIIFKKLKLIYHLLIIFLIYQIDTKIIQNKNYKLNKLIISF